MPNIPLEDPGMRELAAWYRDYSERASTPWVCEGRLRTARGTRPPCRRCWRQAAVRRQGKRREVSDVVNALRETADQSGGYGGGATSRSGAPWRRWGPYLSERQWGTVREDYSEYGNAWEYLPHDPARSRAYRWGEYGIAGFGDDQLYLCLGIALWNERDPILMRVPVERER
jgi:hypothetical protein